MTLDWLGVFLVTTVLCKAELQTPAYWFPFSYSRHSHRDRLAVAWCMSLSLSTLSAKWKRMTLWLIYMVMAVISTFRQIKQLNLGSVLFWEQKKVKLSLLCSSSAYHGGLAVTFFSCQKNWYLVYPMKGRHAFIGHNTSSNPTRTPGYLLP